MHSVRWIQISEVGIVADIRGSSLGEVGPGHKGGELGLVIKVLRAVRLDGSTAEERSHFDRVRDGRSPERDYRRPLF